VKFAFAFARPAFRRIPATSRHGDFSFRIRSAAGIFIAERPLVYLPLSAL
jgi:hypothetical protein